MMNTERLAICALIASFLVLAGCAPSPVDERNREEMEADVDDILSQELDPLEYGEPKTCLLDSEYRSYRALGKRHLLFRGRQGRLWVNTLRGRCPGLDDNSVFIMKPQLAGRLCDMDRFNAVHVFRSLRDAEATPSCVLGEFKPVTEAQVEEIEDRLEKR